MNNDIEADVAIVGAGFTGLWTAYYIKKYSPNTSVVIVEKNHVGFGASGRNGGWCSALFATSLEKLAKNSGREKAREQYLEMVKTLDEIETVLTNEKIEADWQRGGTVTLARDQIQLKKAATEVNHFREWGFDDGYAQLLNKVEASEILNASKVY
ncbi:MAG: NAD(P)/FAD-dependent oxidoreductase, partial [Candidatus Nanopelagicales bacterium]